MSRTRTSAAHATRTPSAGKVDTKLEVVVIPVSDVDRAKRFRNVPPGPGPASVRCEARRPAPA